MPNESSSLRVLMVTPCYFPTVWGVIEHNYEVGRHLARAGVDLMTLTTDVSGRLPAVEESEGMRREHTGE